MVAVAQQHRRLRHPISIFVAVVVMSVVVSVVGVVLFESGWAGALAMLQQSAIGGVGWGVTTAALVWVSRFAYRTWIARR